MPLMVVKKDGRRENFDRQKLLKSLMLACQKRPVMTTQIDNIVLDAERRVMDRAEREIQSRELGEILMNELKQLDNVAYVRFASVYRDFKDLPDFISALEDVLTQRDREVEPSKVKVLQPKQSTPTIERSLFSTDDMKKKNEGTGL
jgi:transcriptional repressor NrdR